MFAIWSCAFSSLNIWKLTVHVLLKPGLENFEHYFTSVWDECNCGVVWAFFGIAFLQNWNENLPFPVLFQSRPLLSFSNLLTYWVQHFHSIIFKIWNSSTGMPSPPLALFIVMLPKAHLTSHSRMSGSRWVWVITPLWLSGLWRSALYSSVKCHKAPIKSNLPHKSLICGQSLMGTVGVCSMRKACREVSGGLDRGSLLKIAHSLGWHVQAHR